MIVVLVLPAVAAGLAGLLAHGADDASAYLPRLRVVLLGATIIGYLGVDAFIWKEGKGWRRWVAFLIGLLAVRVFFVPVVACALVLTGWVEALGLTLGLTNLSPIVHYTFACLVSALTGVSTLLTVAALFNPKDWYAIPMLVLLLAAGMLAFSHDDDRRAWPQAFETSAPAPAYSGPDYREALADGDLSFRARVIAGGGLVRHGLSARGGWSGNVRRELLARFRSSPEGSLKTRLQSLEAALLRSRRTLRTSPPDPRGS
ncbi:MAG: hypothetical protein O7E54_14160 [Planctomycetota bacterium]|nr:hypothetical protein [Planctomycetota bacterium]